MKQRLLFWLAAYVVFCALMVHQLSAALHWDFFPMAKTVLKLTGEITFFAGIASVIVNLFRKSPLSEEAQRTLDGYALAGMVGIVLFNSNDIMIVSIGINLLIVPFMLGMSLGTSIVQAYKRKKSPG